MSARCSRWPACASRFGGRRRRCAAYRCACERGETHCLVGESGCGKSVTALAVMGLLPRGASRQADVLRFHGHDLSRLTERGMARLRGDRMAMIFQEPMTSLNPAYTVGSQMVEVLRAPSRPGAARRRGSVRRRCWRASASPRRRCGWGSIRTSFPAGCASG